MSIVSWAMRTRFSGCTCSSVRMLCRRSASFTSSTRTSFDIASSSLRRFSAWVASLVTRSSLLDLRQPIDQRGDLVAEFLLDLGWWVVSVSSTMS